MKRFYTVLLCAVMLAALGASGAWADGLLKPRITTKSLPDGRVYWHYSEMLSAEGTTPIKWTLVDGGMPKGLGLDEEGGINGTPRDHGRSTFKVRATNSMGYDEKTLSINIPFTTPDDYDDLTFGGSGGCDSGNLGVMSLIFAAAFLKEVLLRRSH